MREYTEEEKVKYCHGFKNCTLPITDYAEKMKLDVEKLKQWIKEYKEPLLYGATDFRKQISSLCNIVKKHNMR